MAESPTPPPSIPSVGPPPTAPDDPSGPAPTGGGLVGPVRAPALEMRGITKRFPGVVANDAIDLEVRPGEIHGLLGENGAGKSTLMNVLYGLLTPDEGEILIDGQVVRIAGPSDAIARGIGMVHQHFMLVPVFTVAENVILGNETMANPVFLDEKASDGRIHTLAQQMGFDVDPEAKVGELSVGIQQRIEILKALYRGARVLILDEPTAVLTPQETVEIFSVLRKLAADGTSIVFISHKLYEVLEIADRITVIRRGKVVGQADPKTATEEELAEMMVGREVSLTVEKGPPKPGEVVLAVDGLTVADDRGSVVVTDCSFEVRAGEIFGIAGVAGNGQDELVEALTGLRKSAPATSRSPDGTSPVTRSAISPSGASPTSPATVSGSASSCRIRSMTTSASPTTTMPRSRSSASSTRGRSGAGPTSSSRGSTSGPRRRRSRRRPCREATSRSSSSPASSVVT